MTPAQIWQRFQQANPNAPSACPPAFHFCDTQTAADTCADLVTAGRKRATCSALASFAQDGEAPPRDGDYAIITDFAGQSVAVIRITQVEIIRFGDVTAEFAFAEGEGDRSLTWWRTAHINYFTRTLASELGPVDDDLLLVCEHFELVMSAAD